MFDKEKSEKIIIEMRKNGALLGEILDAVFPDHNGSSQKMNKVKHMIESLRTRGLIERRGRGNTTKVNRRAPKEGKPKRVYVKKPKCGYPRCRATPEKQFAYVPLCERHHGLIVEETMYFYEGEDQKEYKNRRHYLKIVDQIKHRYKGEKV